jgi:hypothetical protein
MLSTSLQCKSRRNWAHACLVSHERNFQLAANFLLRFWYLSLSLSLRRLCTHTHTLAQNNVIYCTHKFTTWCEPTIIICVIESNNCITAKYKTRDVSWYAISVGEENNLFLLPTQLWVEHEACNWNCSTSWCAVHHNSNNVFINIII